MKSKYAGYLLAAVILLLACCDTATAQAAEAGFQTGTSISDSDKRLAEKSYFRGMQMLSHNMLESAVKDFEKALELNPSHYNTYLMLGKAYIRLEKFKESEDTFWKAVKLTPGEAEAYDNLMTLYLYLERPEDAVRSAEEALGAGVDFSALPDIGWSYYQAGMDDKAEVAYKKQLDQNPALFGPNRNLGILFFNRGEYEKALEHYEKAEKDYPESNTLPYLKALAYEKLGKKQEASNEVLNLKKRDLKYSRKIATFNKRFFPHNPDPGNLKEYIYGLKPGWDKQEKSPYEQMIERSKARQDSQSGTDEEVPDGATPAAQEGGGEATSPADAGPDAQGIAE